MAKKLYEEADVQAVAAAIRLRNGSSTTYKLSQMASAIESMKTGDKYVQTDVPEYVRTEALAVAKKVSAVQTTDSITFIAASDAHHHSDDEYIADGNLHAGMAMKALSYILPGIDSCCFLGDYSIGSETTTLAQGRQHFAEINAILKEGFGGIPQFRTPGDRDGLRRALETNDNTWLQPKEIYTYVGRYNEGATYGSTTEGYCYRDFDEKKLRVFCLSTAEIGMSWDNVSLTQRLWFARALKAVGAKAGWGIVILSHYPLDFTENQDKNSSAKTLGNILKQYVDGGSVTLSGMTVSFKDSNSAKIYAAFHGHTHNFAVAKLSDVQDSGNTEFDVLRVATPNMCYFYNNELGSNEGADSNGIEYGETTTYAKTHDTADDTSFVVNVINPSEGKIHSFCYGAGYDREITIPSSGE